MTNQLVRGLLGSALLMCSHAAFSQSETAPATEPAASKPPASLADIAAEPAPAADAAPAAMPAEAAPAASASEAPAAAEAPASKSATAASTPAAARQLAVAARLSTLGLGVELIGGINSRINLRLQGNFFDYSKSIEEDGVDYDGKLKLQTFGLLADLHPFAGGFRLSGGLYQNGNKLKLDASCNAECEVGDLTIVNNAGDNGRLFGRAKFNSFSPYVGLGFGNAMRGFPLHFGLDVGVLLQGAPRIKLGADGFATVRDNDTGMTTRENLATNQEVQDALSAEADNAEEDTKEFKYYPVANFTLGYRFGL